MSSPTRGKSFNLSIEIEQELHDKLERAAADRAVTVRDYVADALRRALDIDMGDNLDSESAAWRILSSASFVRDWDCEEDQVYDHLP